MSLADKMENTLSNNFEFRMRAGFLQGLFMAVLVTVVSGLLSGCAGTAKGRDTSVYRQTYREQLK